MESHLQKEDHIYKAYTLWFFTNVMKLLKSFVHVNGIVLTP